ncbi:MAG: DUF4214 domain-containing protein [Pseudomonadota bacterium]
MAGINDDYPSDTSTSGVLAVGQSAKGVFETEMDWDWFRVSLQAGTTYLLSLDTSQLVFGSDGQDSYPPYLALREAGGAVLAYDNGYGQGSSLYVQYTPEKSGNFYLSAETLFGKFGRYTVSAAVKPATGDDFPSSTTTTAVLPAGGTAQGRFEVAGDRDWFKFHAEVGKHYFFGSPIEPSGQSVRPTIQLLDASGKIEILPTTPFEPLKSGDYFVVAQGNTSGSYTLRSVLREDDYASNESTTGRLVPGSQVSGALQYRYDDDGFKFSVQANTYYTVELSGDAADQRLLDLSLIGSDGKIVQTTATRSGSGALSATFKAALSDDIYAHVSGYSLPSGLTHGPYTLKALATAQDDFGDTPATATAVAIGADIKGRIEAQGDIDVVKLSLKAGVTYAIDVQQVSEGTASANPYLSLALVNTDGLSAIALYDKTGSDATFAPQQDGDYFIKTSVSYGSATSYVLHASLAQDDYSANATTTGILKVGGSATGVLEAGGGDRDWFAVKLDAGTTYWFSLAGAGARGGTLTSNLSGTSVMKLLDAKGNVLATVGGNGDSYAPIMPFAPSASGTYYVEVSQSDHATGSYTVAARIGVTDDFGASAADAGGLTEGVKITGKLEHANDVDAFKLSVKAGYTYKLDVAPVKLDGASSPPLKTLDGANGGNKYVSLRNVDGHTFFEAKESGNFYFTVGDGSRNGTGSYTLVANTVGKDDYPTGPSTGGTLAPNGETRGTLDVPDDIDWIKIALEAGKSYVFDLRGSTSGAGSLKTSGSSTELNIYGASGYSLAAHNGAAAEPRLEFTATTSGDYYIAVGSSRNYQIGSYTLRATTTTGDVSAPVVTAHSPLAGSAAIGLNDNIVLTFNEAIKADRNAVTLRDAGGGALSLVYDQALALDNALIINPGITLRPGQTYTLDIAAGGVKDLAGNAYAGPRTYSFATAPLVTTGGAGNDYLAGSGKGAQLAGGAGVDTAVYELPSYSYTVHRANGQATVSTRGGGTGDTLTSVERIMFEYDSLALDIDGAGGQAYRLFQAAFNRSPEKVGVGFWMAALDNGTSLHTVAQGFIDSGEFKALYGQAPSNAAFVNQLYLNALHRPGEQAGLAYWNQKLEAGMARADVLVAFSESVENQAALVGKIGDGFSYTPYYG